MVNKLHRALKEKATCEAIKLILDKCPEAVTVKNIGYGELPLHFALEEKSCHDVIQVLLEAYPIAVQVKSKQGWLPLHYALRYNASDNTTLMILKAFPRAAESPDNEGEFPLDFALRNNASDDIITEILEAYPKAAEMRIEGDDFPLHLAIRHGYLDYVINILYDAYQEAIQKQNIDGCLPLHIACDHRASNYVIKMLFEHFPDAAKMQNQKGWLPLHLALRHKACDDVLKMLFTAYPKASEVKNRYGYLPLHYALQENASDDIVTMLYNEYPKALKVKNKDGKTPLDYAPNRIVPPPVVKPAPRIDLMHPLLRQLASVYSDPIHISQEILQLFNSSEGSSLTPQVSFKDHNRLLALDGNLTVVVNEKKCSIPVEILIPSGYPSDSPICYLCPYPVTTIEETHQSLGSDHKINLPYRFISNSLVEFVKNLCTYFGEFPPACQQPQPIVKNASQQLLDLCIKAYQIRNNESHKNIQIWLNKKKDNHNLVREAITFKGVYDRTPLHYVAGSKPPKDLVENILNHGKDLLKIRDAEGKLPLHWACCNEADPEVVESLVMGYPESVEKQDHDTYTPLHYECCVRASFVVVAKMLQKCPSAARVHNKDTDLPLHIICKGTVAASSSVVNLLIDYFPESISELSQQLIHDSVYKTVLCQASFPAPSKNDSGHQNEIYIWNKTGRCLKVVYHKSQRPNFLSQVGLSAWIVSLRLRIAERKKSNIDRAGLKIIAPNINESFEVPSSCNGLYFDFFCNTNDSYFWEQNKFVRKGYTQEVFGQPYKLGE